MYQVLSWFPIWIMRRSLLRLVLPLRALRAIYLEGFSCIILKRHRDFVKNRLIPITVTWPVFKWYVSAGFYAQVCHLHMSSTCGFVKWTCGCSECQDMCNTLHRIMLCWGDLKTESKILCIVVHRECHLLFLLQIYNLNDLHAVKKRIKVNLSEPLS